jgi:predicted small secreted protein
VKNKTLALLLLVSFTLTACNLGASAPQDGSAIATAAAQTVEAALTSSAVQAATPQASPIPGVAIDGTTAEPADTAACEDNNIIISWQRDGATYDKKAVDTPLAPGTNFSMSWVLENNGTCIWDDAIVFKFTEGERLTVQDEIPVMPKGYKVSTGEQLTINVQMTAPTTPGSYETSFSLVNAEGKNVVNFGVLTTVGNAVSTSLASPKDLRYTYDCSGGTVNISLFWVDVSADETGFRIYRDGAQVGEVPAGATSFSEIAPGVGTFNYSVAAFNASGEAPANMPVTTSNCQ